ncbi:MAG: DUF1292 domain-containing protein [Clostridiales bacterium]|jgi:uncharacterized protein YrzB (UPF0473 family)|nr:DUF1292 domain-containing protein [Clostridiales bacterium]HOA34390.1 DUF1292 domain-containing protein [Clostridiales bacterium]HOJ35875.1 DUF1292 domain-containing protein [Clostridiales bacterium]HPP68912.1 DUF1292 domain-containing protein [Clostridiales bacterium]HPU67053.1 DUF1292 domain-containing protein [Clostridiales bacterium]
MSDEYGPDIVSVIDEEGREHVFEELDRIETDEGKYVALIPVYDDPEESLEDSGELIILKVEEEDGEIYLCPIEDEEEFETVGNIFEDRLIEFYELEKESEEE